MWSAGNNARRRSSFAGFTVIELLVVLTILAALTSLIVPRLDRSTALESKSMAHVIAASLRRARAAAITNVRDQTLRFDLDANRISADHLPAPLTLTKGLQYELTVAASERTGERSGAIRFFPNGSSTGGRVSVVSARQAYHVDVEWFTGRTRILSEAIDAH